MNNIKLSIVIPYKNTKDYMEKCLVSVCNQNISNYEVIIIDDNSDEDISLIINEFKSKADIRYKRLSSSIGPGGARNEGIKLAKGEYIGFCDSDDWIDLDMYSKSVYLMDKYEADIGMVSQVREDDSSDNKNKLFKCKYDEMMELDSDLCFRIMTYELNLGVKIIPPCINKIYRRQFLASNHLLFEEHMYFQDVIFNVKAILQTNKILCIPNVTYHHYRRPNSIIQSFSQKHINDFEKLFTLIKEFLISENLYDKYCNNYYKLMDHFYGIIIREIFEFTEEDQLRKEYMVESFNALKRLISIDEYIQHTSSEDIRRHLQPYITDTKLY